MNAFPSSIAPISEFSGLNDGPPDDVADILMKQAAAKRAARKAPARSIRRLVPFNECGLNAVVEITVGKEIACYLVHKLPSDFGIGFEVEKIDEDGIGESDIYQVNLDGTRSCCDCKGHLQHGHCKHVSGLQALLNADLL